MTANKNTLILQWLQSAMAHAQNMSGAELGRRLAQNLSAGFDRSMVQKMLSGSRTMSAAELLAVEEITGYPAPVARNIPLISWSKVGDCPNCLSLIEDDARAVAAFDLGPGNFFATLVEDDAMDRISPPGSMIIVDRNDRTLIDDKCYLAAVAGRTAYGMYRARGPGFLAPWSLNLEHTSILVTDIEAVIGRVRRTVLDL